MEAIADKLENVIQEKIIVYSKDLKYNELKEYLLEMKSNGFVQPKLYDLPPLDTVGKRLYQSK
jgi:hypothetical protein